jgi:hypothetical protein
MIRAHFPAQKTRGQAKEKRADTPSAKTTTG